MLIVFALAARQRVIPPRTSWGLLALAGMLDAGGNVFFLLAVQSGRLDISAVLGSLYPAVTAGLALVIAGEKMARLQAVGVVTAIAAIVLITV